MEGGLRDTPKRKASRAHRERHTNERSDEKTRSLQERARLTARRAAAAPKAAPLALNLNSALAGGRASKRSRADSFHLPEFDGQVHCLRKFFERAAFPRAACTSKFPRAREHLRDVRHSRVTRQDVPELRARRLRFRKPKAKVHCHRRGAVDV